MSGITKIQKQTSLILTPDQRSSSAKNSDSIADKMTEAMQRAHEDCSKQGAMPSKYAMKNAFKHLSSSSSLMHSVPEKESSSNEITQVGKQLLHSQSDSRLSSSTTSLNTPSSVEDSPRKAAAKLLEGLELNVKNPGVSRAIFLEDAVKSETSSSLDGILKVEKKVLQSRPVHYDSLKAMLDSCRDDFTRFAKENSNKKIIQGAFLPKGFLILKDLFLSVESKEFLDCYIVRDSQIQKNQHPDMQKKFDAFSQKIEKLKTSLHDIGICGVEEGKSINFWSGREGQQMAADDEALSDSDVPLFKFLFDCWGLIKQRELQKPGIAKELISMLPTLFSALFASYAKQEVNVWMSSKNDGKTSVINVESAFWSAELYALINNPQVTKINLMLHQGKDEQGKDLWADPIDLKSNDQEHVVRKDSLCLSKRGDADLQVSMGAIKKKLSTWNEKAKRSSES